MRNRKEKVRMAFSLWCLMWLSLCSMTGCDLETEEVTVTTYLLECCGTAKLYSDKTLVVTGCNHFYCKMSNGRWAKVTGGYSFSNKSNGKMAIGQIYNGRMDIAAL